MLICCIRVWYIFDFLITLFRISQMMPGGMPGGGMGGGRAPMLVLNPNTQRQGDDSTKTQTQNVGAAKVGWIHTYTPFLLSLKKSTAVAGEADRELTRVSFRVCSIIKCKKSARQVLAEFSLTIASKKLLTYTFKNCLRCIEKHFKMTIWSNYRCHHFLFVRESVLFGHPAFNTRRFFE